MCVPETQYTSILRVSRVLVRAACCPIRLSVKMLKAVKGSEYLGLRNASKLLLLVLLMLSSGGTIMPQFFVSPPVIRYKRRTEIKQVLIYKGYWNISGDRRFGVAHATGTVFLWKS